MINVPYLVSQIVRLYSGVCSGLNSEVLFWGAIPGFFSPSGIILDMPILMLTLPHVSFQKTVSALFLIKELLAHSGSIGRHHLLYRVHLQETFIPVT